VTEHAFQIRVYIWSLTEKSVSRYFYFERRQLGQVHEWRAAAASSPNNWSTGAENAFADVFDCLVNGSQNLTSDLCDSPEFYDPYTPQARSVRRPTVSSAS